MSILEFLADKGLLREAMENLLEFRGTEFKGDTIEDAMAFVEEEPSIEGLMPMFAWMDTEQGHEFWYDLHMEFSSKPENKEFSSKPENKEFSSKPENKEFMTTWDVCVHLGIQAEVSIEVMLQTELPSDEIVEYLTQSPGLVTAFSFDDAVKGHDYWDAKNEEFMEFTGMTSEDILMRLLAIK